MKGNLQREVHVVLSSVSEFQGTRFNTNGKRMACSFYVFGKGRGGLGWIRMRRGIPAIELLSTVDCGAIIEEEFQAS